VPLKPERRGKREAEKEERRINLVDRNTSRREEGTHTTRERSRATNVRVCAGDQGTNIKLGYGDASYQGGS